MDEIKLSVEEKIRLFNGDGSWQNYSAEGRLPYFTMSDGPHGLRKQDAEEYADLNKSRVATCFPTASCMASSWDRELLGRLGQAIAEEALAQVKLVRQKFWKRQMCLLQRQPADSFLCSGLALRLFQLRQFLQHGSF